MARRRAEDERGRGGGIDPLRLSARRRDTCQAAVAVFAAALGACSTADGGTPGPETPTGGSDGGSASRDGGSGADPDDGADASAGFDGLSPGASPGRGDYEDGSSDPSACYDARDNDANDATDCNDSACSALPSCCSGSSACCAPITPSPLPPELMPDACVGAPSLAACLASLGAEADPASVRLTEGAFVFGDARASGAMAVGDAVDLHVVRTQLRFRIRSAASCGGTCVEGVSVAWAPADSRAGDDMDPLVGVTFSSSRGTGRLVVGPTLVAEWAHGSADDASTYELTTTPAGEVILARDGARLATARFETSRAATLWLLGRSRGAGEPSAGLTSLATTVERCDVPWAFEPARELAVERADGGGRFVLDGADEPSRATKDGAEWLAFARDGEIFVAAQTEPDTYLLLSDGAALRGGSPLDERGVADPELLVTARGLELVYTGTGADGVRSLLRATLDGTRFTRQDAAAVDPRALEGVRHVDHPTVAIHSSGTFVLVAQLERLDGTRTLALFTSPDGVRYAPVRSDALAALGETIAAPSLTAYNDAWHVYGTDSRGARGGVALFVSDDLLHFRAAEGDARVFAPGSTGVDRLGVSSPDVTASGSVVSLVYRGTDGERTTLLSTRRVGVVGGSRR